MNKSAPSLSAASHAPGMDVPRRSGRARRRLLTIAGGSVLLLTVLVVALSSRGVAVPSVEREGLWIERVQRGAMVRQVQGPGILVPEHIRWISAVAPARVERILVQPGTAVQPDTVLLELSNPDLELAALEAERQVASASAEISNLEANQRSARLAQESMLSSVRSELHQSRRQASADEALAQRGFLSELEMAQSRGKAEELGTRLEFEQKRLSALADGMKAQLSAQQTQLEGLRWIAQFRRREADALSVRAGLAGVLQEQPLQLGQWVAPGSLLAKVAQPDKLKAELSIAEVQAKDVQVGQSVSVDTRNGMIAGKVARVDPAVQAGSVKVEVRLEGALPPGARPDLSVQGSVELERLHDVLFMGRPTLGASEGTVGLFKLAADGSQADRVKVQLGRSSVRTVEVRGGLREGDQVILSDTSRWDSVERIRLQ